jgi:FkbM family methyltransferase
MEIGRWLKDNAEHLRYEYDLNPNSVVLDIGLYKGDFAARIHKKYKCKVIGFEPIKKFYEQSKNRFANNPKVKVYHCGVGDKDETIEISIDNDASSAFKDKGNKCEEVKIISINTMLEENNIHNVDLLKINVEGYEYEILDSILENDIVSIFRNIQVQFHNFVPNAEEKRKRIRNRLLETHYLTYDYKFVWENYAL